MTCAIDTVVFNDWFPSVMLLTVGVLVGISLTYMVSYVINNPELRAKLKLLLLRWFVSVVIVAFVSASAMYLCDFSSTVFDEGDPFQLAIKFVTSVGEYEFTKGYNLIWKSIMVARTEASVNIGFLACFQGGCFDPAAGFNYLSYHLDTVQNIFLPISASLVVQKFVLAIVHSYFMAYLFPLGIAFMYLPALREIGAYLISLAVSFYFIMPMVYSMGVLVYNEEYKMMNDFIQDDVSSAIDDFYVPSFYATTSSSLEPNKLFTTITWLSMLSAYLYSIPLLAITLSVAGSRVLYSVLKSASILEEMI